MKRILLIILSTICYLALGASSDIKVEVLQSGSSQANNIEAISASGSWVKTEIPFFQVTDKPNWVKLTVPAMKEEQILVFTNPLTDSLLVFQRSSSPINLGLSAPYNLHRYSEYTQPNVLLSASDSERELFVRVQSNSLTSLPVKLFSLREFNTYTSTNQIFAGVYFGILLVMLLYNLFVYFSVQEKAYLYYCLYILALIVTQMVLQGFAKKLFFSYNYGFNQYSVVITGGLLGLATLAFSYHFLQIKKFLPKFKKYLLFLGVLCILSIVLSLMGLHIIAFNLVNTTIGIGSLVLLFLAYRVYQKGYRPASFYVIAFAVLLIGTAIYVLKDYGILPYNNFTYYGYQVGSVIQVVLLSLALANSINILKKEKEKEQLEKLEALRENARIIENQKETLRKQVEEKTSELTLANKDLTKTLKDLKSAQVSLVESEKMASLGQLTAGVAHEINNPINFVSSNVNPLIRDFEDINEFISNILRKSEEKEQVVSEEIKKLYEEMDIDYTIAEISELLNGIKEGADRTAEIVKGLKNFSRLDEAAFKTANLEEGLDSTLILLRSNMKGEIDIVKNYGGVPDIDCYAGKLNQVFMNLINNSIYAMNMDKSREDKNGGRLILETKDLEDAIVISIADNGSGMDKKTKEKLFEPFFTTKPVGEGTGLGMSIIYSIINDLHEGSIQVESELGVGTKITITLPKKLKK